MFVKCPLCDKHYAKSWGSRNKENRKKKKFYPWDMYIPLGPDKQKTR